MSHSKLFGFTCWMIALAGVFGGGLYLLFDSGVSADLNTGSWGWLEVAIQDLFSLTMIATAVGFALMVAALISAVSLFFTAKAAESGVLMEIDRELMHEAHVAASKPVVAAKPAVVTSAVAVEKKTVVKKKKPAAKKKVTKKK